jgi:hypothetical protein
MMKSHSYFTRKKNRIILVQNEVALPQNKFVRAKRNFSSGQKQ